MLGSKDKHTFIYSAHSVRSAMRSYMVKMGLDAKNTSKISPPGLSMSYMCSISLLWKFKKNL